MPNRFEILHRAPLAVSLPCSVQIFKTIRQSKKMDVMDDYLNLRLVSDDSLGWCRWLLRLSELSQYPIECPSNSPPPPHQLLSPNQSPQQGESIVKPGTPLLIILSLVCKSDMKEVHGNLSNPLSKEKVRGQNILEVWINAAIVSHILINAY